VKIQMVYKLKMAFKMIELIKAIIGFEHFNKDNDSDFAIVKYW